MSRTSAKAWESVISRSSPSSVALESSSRSTIFSPKRLGSTLTRKSTVLP